MGNTTKIQNQFLQVKGLDADWSTPGDLAGFVESGIMVKSITFHPSGVNDVMIIKEGQPDDTTTVLAVANTTTAPELFHVKCAGDTDQRIRYFGDRGRRMYPFIDISDCTLATAANARVEFELA